jgi:hypothetical protein
MFYWNHNYLCCLPDNHMLSHNYYYYYYYYLFIYFLLCYSYWGETKSIWYCGHYWPIVRAPGDRWWWLWSNWWNEDWQGKPKCSEKTCPSATLSTTNPTWPDLWHNRPHTIPKPWSWIINMWTRRCSDLPFLLSGLFLMQTVIWWSSTGSDSRRGRNSILLRYSLETTI